jgi:hypothetical protein
MRESHIHGIKNQEYLGYYISQPSFASWKAAITRPGPA